MCLVAMTGQCAVPPDWPDVIDRAESHNKLNLPRDPAHSWALLSTTPSSSTFLHSIAPALHLAARRHNMKRAADEPPVADQQQRKRPGPSPSNPSTANGYSHQPFSPASVASPSPQHQQTHTGNFKKFLGCSRFDDYELEDKLGEGTFGEVHKARRKSTGELVALKRILMHNEKDGVPITALREIKILKQLSHTNIVSLTDIAVQRGTPPHVDKITGDRKERERGAIFMVFPYMDHDLAGLLENSSVPKFQPPQVKLYLKQLLEGTLYLHKNKILHRDMKAANLLINNKGVLKIADFGLARGFEEGKDYTNCVVTRWYRPPELLLGEKKYTTAIDMWGIGCVFAEMLTGKPILQGPSDADQLKLIFDLCGTPTDETMPNWRDLPDAANYDPYKEKGGGPRQNNIAERFAKWGTQAVDLIEKLLMLDPKKRISAFQALDHDYFWTPPMPAEPDDIPEYEASHEYDRRKQRERQVEGAPPQPPNAPRGGAGGSQAPNGGPSNRGGGYNGSGGGGRGARGGDHHAGDSYRPGGYGGGSKDDRERREHRDGGHRDRERDRERDRDRERYDKDKDRPRDRDRSRDRDRAERASSLGAASVASGSSSKGERQVHALPPKPTTIVPPALPPPGQQGGQGRRY